MTEKESSIVQKQRVQWWCTLTDPYGNTEQVTEKRYIDLELAVDKFSTESVEEIKKQLNLDTYVTDEELKTELGSLDYVTDEELGEELTKLDYVTDEELKTALGELDFVTNKELNNAIVSAVKDELTIAEDIILTHDFGKYEIKDDGNVITESTGKTVKEWIVDAFSEEKDPEVISPDFTIKARAICPDGLEIGSYITKLSWESDTTYGNYQYGPSTGLSVNNRKLLISSDITSLTSDQEDGAFDVSIQLDNDIAKTYANITGICSIDVSGVSTPNTNLGNACDSKKIKPNAGSDLQINSTVGINITAYRKPFWGVLSSDGILDIDNLKSSNIRNLPESGSKTKGLPAAIDVPVNTQMIIFAAKSGEYDSLVATDSLGQNATVSFDKISNAVEVAGANDFTPTAYDIWYVKWPAGISNAKKLVLKWS